MSRLQQAARRYVWTGTDTVSQVQIACGDRHRGKKNLYKKERQKTRTPVIELLPTRMLAFLFLLREQFKRKNEERTSQKNAN